MLLNELIQWAALVLLGVFVLGLTRQLGDFLVPPRERLSSNRGPALGKVVPEAVLPAPHRDRLTALMAERETDWAALVFVSDDCPRCEILLDSLRAAGSPQHAPVVALTVSERERHHALLSEVADVVIADPRLPDSAALTVTPFVMLVDRSLKVRHKELASSVAGAFGAWRPAAPVTDAPASIAGEGLTIVEVGR